MRNLFKYGIMAFMFSLMFISVDSISAQSWKRERDARREYREDVRDARRDYRDNVRDGNYRKAQREYRDDIRDARRDYRQDSNRRYNNYPYYNNNNRYYNNNNRGYWRNGIFIRLW